MVLEVVMLHNTEVWGPGDYAYRRVGAVCRVSCPYAAIVIPMGLQKMSGQHIVTTKKSG